MRVKEGTARILLGMTRIGRFARERGGKLGIGYAIGRQGSDGRGANGQTLENRDQKETR